MGADPDGPLAALVRTDDAPASLPLVVLFTAERPTMNMGRADSNAVVLVDKRVSKLHCKLALRTCRQKGVDNGEPLRRIFVRDASSFGTFINGMVVQKEQWVVLQEGDVLAMRNPAGSSGLGEYRAQYSELAPLATLASTAASPPTATPPPFAASHATVAAPAAPPPASASLAASVVAAETTPIEVPLVGVAPGAAGGDAEPAPGSPVSQCSEVSAPDLQLPGPVLPLATAFSPMLGMPGGMMMAGAPLQGLQGLQMQGMQMSGMQMQSMQMQGMQMTGMQGMMPSMMPGMMPGMVGMPAGMFPTMMGMPGMAHQMSPSSGGVERRSGPPPPRSGQPPATAMVVDEEMIGKIIGRGGEVVKLLQRDSGARIDVAKGVDQSGKRNVFISGSQASIDKAKQMIEDVLKQAKDPEKAGGPTIIKISLEQIGKLIGRGGDVIRDMERESGARLDIRRDVNATDSEERQVHISGAMEAVEYARKMVVERLGLGRQAEIQGAAGGGAAAASAPAPKPIEDARPAQPAQPAQKLHEAVQVRNDLIRLLVGRGGETINSISRDCGVRIDVDRGEEAERASSRAVHISGPTQGIEKAKRMIEETLGLSRAPPRERSRSRSQPRSLPPVMEPPPAPAPAVLAFAATPAAKKVMRVARDLVGTLIGKGGETIVALSRDTGAKIEVSKDDSDADRSVIISGTEEAVEKAAAKIEESLRLAKERFEARSSNKHRSRSRSRRRASAAESALVLVAPKAEEVISESIYVDELDMPLRPTARELEDGLMTDLEIFVRGLPQECTERELWDYLCRVGASDVREILLLRRQRVSKGMAYIVFNRHDHAVAAKRGLHGVPTSSVVRGARGGGRLEARFSESERCIAGKANVYGADIASMLLGAQSDASEKLKEASGLRGVTIAGRCARPRGGHAADPRLHMVLKYASGEAENVGKAVKLWAEQLAAVHNQLAEQRAAAAAAAAVPAAAVYAAPLALPPLALEAPALLWEGAPVLLRRCRAAVAEGEETADQASVEVLEATCLRGQELRWQPWPTASGFNAARSVIPLRWRAGAERAELLVLLRERCSGDLKVCLAELGQPLERWPVLGTPATISKATKLRPFTFQDSLYIIALDRESGSLQVHHMPDPSAPWTSVFETTLDALPGVGDLGLSRSAKLRVFYAPDQSPHVVAVESSAEGGAAAKVFRIEDPAKAWARQVHAPPMCAKSRVLPVYMRTSPSRANVFDVFLVSVDPSKGEVTVHAMPSSAEEPWLFLSSQPLKGDSRMFCAYVPGRVEPVLMAGSESDRKLLLCHLHLAEWSAARRTEGAPLPEAPVIEEKLSRPMASVWPDEHLGPDAGVVVARPLDCSTDLPISRHPWAAATPPVASAVPPVAASAAPAAASTAPATGVPPTTPPPPAGPPPPRPGAGDATSLLQRPPFGPPQGGFEGPLGRPPPGGPLGVPPGPPPGNPPGAWPPAARPPFGMPFGGPPGWPPMGGRPPPPGYPGGPPPGYPGGPPPGYPGGPPHGYPGGPPPCYPGGPPPGFPGFPGFPRPAAPPGAAGPWAPRPGASPPVSGHPSTWEVGFSVEALRADGTAWQPARISAKLGDRGFDIEYATGNMEWQVPASRLRPPAASGAPGVPPAAGALALPAPGAAGAPGLGAEADAERKRHRHRRKRRRDRSESS